MNKKWLGAGAALLLGGCASVEMAQYTVTSFAEIPLKKQAKVKIVANDDALGAIADSLKGEFKKSDSFGVVEKDADYWFVLNGAEQYVKSESQKKVSVVKQETESGGQETFAETTQNLASAAKGVSVAVYEAKTLAPVHYFEIPIYAGDNTKDGVRDAAVYNAAFSKEVVERIMDTFVTQQKQVETPISKKGDSDLREKFKAAGNASNVAKAYETLTAEICKKYAAFVRKYKLVHGKIDLAKMLAAIEAKEYDGEIPAETVLSDYHMYLLIDEFNATRKTDIETLKKIRDQHLMILEHTSENGLVEAIPVALARLEYKLANLGE